MAARRKSPPLATRIRQTPRNGGLSPTTNAAIRLGRWGTWEPIKILSINQCDNADGYNGYSIVGYTENGHIVRHIMDIKMYTDFSLLLGWLA